MYFFRILHQNRSQSIIQCLDNNIWKQICIKKYLLLLRPIFDTTYKGGKQVEKYMWAIHHKLVLLVQSRNFFAMYHRMRLKGISWAGPRHNPPLDPPSNFPGNVFHLLTLIQVCNIIPFTTLVLGSLLPIWTWWDQVSNLCMVPEEWGGPITCKCNFNVRH